MASLLEPGKDETPNSIRGTILLVEDNLDDATLIGLAMKGLGDISLVTVPDGQEAVHYLNREGPSVARERSELPQLILLDLDMPVMDGFQFLGWLREQPALKDLPVIVLTTSTFSPDVNRAYRLGANSVLVKPTDFHQLSAALQGVIDFWLTKRRLETGQKESVDADTGTDLPPLGGLVIPPQRVEPLPPGSAV